MFIVLLHLVLKLYALVQAAGAVRILLGLVPLLAICLLAAPVDLVRWLRRRKQRAKAAARYADYRRRLDAAIERADIRLAERGEDYDENGVSYDP